MRRAVLLLLGTVVAATLLPPAGGATGGRYAFTGGTPRRLLGCERFASMLAWAYWPSPDNCMRPAGGER